MPTIAPFLWFDGKAEEAANFYISLFEDGTVLDVRRWSGAGPGPVGGVMSVTFRLAGQEYIALNGGPQFTFSPAISLFTRCDTQAEVDRLWEALSEGGRAHQCGWITDRFGVTWQVVPRQLGAMLADKDPARSKRVFAAMMTMIKLDLPTLQAAYDAA